MIRPHQPFFPHNAQSLGLQFVISAFWYHISAISELPLHLSTAWRNSLRASQSEPLFRSRMQLTGCALISHRDGLIVYTPYKNIININSIYYNSLYYNISIQLYYTIGNFRRISFSSRRWRQPLPLYDVKIIAPQSCSNPPSFRSIRWC